MIQSAKTTAQAAGERYFRLYQKHSAVPDIDTLFNLLNGMHSLNDRLKKATDRTLFDIDEFTALKALRNLFHHSEELLYEVKIIPSQELPPISADLLFLCLIPEPLVQLALKQVDRKYRVQTVIAIEHTFKTYGSIVNINPCLFNLSVRIYERLREAGVRLDGEAYNDFDASYAREEESGRSHFVTGEIYCHAGSVDEILKKVFSKGARS